MCLRTFVTMTSSPSTTVIASRSTHSGFNDIPVELIRHICSFVYPNCFKTEPTCYEWNRGQIQLSRLSRTCRRLHTIVQPLVYHCFSDWGRESLPRLIRFIRTLKERPDLAQHVKSITHQDPYAGELDVESKKYVEKAIIDLELPAVSEGWNIDGEGEYRLIPLEVLLTLTPNLETLRIPLDCDWRLHLLPQLIKTNPPFLTKLNTLKVFHYFIAGDRWDVCFAAVVALCEAAPNLRTLCLPTPDIDSAGSAPLPLANLRRLLLYHNCFISPEGLTWILESAPLLEVIALHWDAMAGEYSADCQVTDMWHALERCKGTLREVRLDVRNDTEHGMTERTSMADFTALEVLAVDGHSLHSLKQAWDRTHRGSSVEFLSEFFPASTRDVTFWNPDAGELQEAMLRFARAARGGRYPNLRRVVLAPSEKSDRWAEGEWARPERWDKVRSELEDEFRQGGAEFEIWKESPNWRGSSH